MPRSQCGITEIEELGLDRVKDGEGKGKISCVACQLQKARTVFPRGLSYTYRILRTKGKGSASGHT